MTRIIETETEKTIKESTDQIIGLEDILFKSLIDDDCKKMVKQF